MSVLNTATGFIKTNSSAIFTGFAIAGVITTAVAAGKASIKAEHILEDMPEDATSKEKFKKVAPSFIPAAIFAIATIGCICSSHTIDARKQMALLSAYSMTEKAMKSFEEKTKETVTKKNYNQIKNDIAKESVEQNPVVKESIIDTGKGTVKFRDGVFGGDFYSDLEYVKSVFNKYNSILNEGVDTVYVNDIRYDLGLPQVKMGGILGWDSGQLDPRLESVILETDLQEATPETVDNIFVILYELPTPQHYGY